jgi:hypothetical protein
VNIFFARFIRGKLLISRFIISTLKFWIKALVFWRLVFKVMRIIPLSNKLCCVEDHISLVNSK